MTGKLVGVLIGTALALAYSTSARAQPTTVIVVKGSVRDSSGNALSGVIVELWQREQPPKKTPATGPDGSYRIEAPAGPEIDQIRYTRSDLEPGVVERLAGKEDHQIVKVLYKPGTPRSVHAADDQLRAYEKFLFTAIAATKEDQGRLFGQLQELDLLNRLAALPIPGPERPDQELAIDLLKRAKERIVSLYARYGR